MKKINIHLIKGCLLWACVFCSMAACSAQQMEAYDSVPVGTYEVSVRRENLVPVLENHFGFTVVDPDGDIGSVNWNK